MDKQTEKVEALSAQIVQWENEIARLEDKAKSAAQGADGSIRDAIEALQSKRAEAQKQLQGIGAKEGILDEVKSDLRDAVLKVK
jgi:chromosome segregation ATPase